MVSANRARTQTALIITFFFPIALYYKERTQFSFEETLGISPWLVLIGVLCIAGALAFVASRKSLDHSKANDNKD